MMRFLFCAAFLISFMQCLSADNSYRFALVRELSNSFENSLKINPPKVPIDIAAARQQHAAYIELLQHLGPTVIVLPGDDHHPDCNFIEDTAIVVGDVAVISIMGAVERQGEEVVIEPALRQLGLTEIYALKKPATMDGGDILYTGRHLFVGISKRTNLAAYEQLKALFKGCVEVVAIPVTEGLHLKSVITAFDEKTLIVADTNAGQTVQKTIDAKLGSAYRFAAVPDSIASNVVRISETLIVQEGFPASEQILQKLCDENNIQLVTLNMSELIKADGALTCGSLLIP